jgi:hypothetical protein
MRTLAGGLPRPLFGAPPWVALWLSSWEDRADCGLFVSGGVSAAQVCSAVEQAFGAATVQKAPGIVPRLDYERQLRVASLKSPWRCRAIVSGWVPHGYHDRHGYRFGYQTSEIAHVKAVLDRENPPVTMFVGAPQAVFQAAGRGFDSRRAH